MPPIFIQYADFDTRVANHVGDRSYHEKKFNLPLVDIFHRDRFLFALDCCDCIDTCMQIVDKGSKLAEQHFRRFACYMSKR